MASFLYKDLRVVYHNLVRIELRHAKENSSNNGSSNRTRRLQSESLRFEGEAYFSGQAPNEADLRANQDTSVANLPDEILNDWTLDSGNVGLLTPQVPHDADTEGKDDDDDDNDKIVVPSSSSGMYHLAQMGLALATSSVVLLLL